MTAIVEDSTKRAKMTPTSSDVLERGGEEVPLRLRIKKLSEHGRAPERGSKGAAGYDLFSAVEVTIPAKGKALVATDISLAIPDGHYGRVAPRSGLAHKHFLDVGAGVIDSDYRGPLGVILFNFGEAPFEVKRGDRIAQLILERISTPSVEIVEVSRVLIGTHPFARVGFGRNNPRRRWLWLNGSMINNALLIIHCNGVMLCQDACALLVLEMPRSDLQV